MVSTIEQKVADINEYLSSIFEYKSNSLSHKKIIDSMTYSLMAGGKRLRPLLMLSVYEDIAKKKYEVPQLRFASAIEMIHTYSIIHDDLPAMDDDDYRRGKLTNHKVFGEAMAILAGDALLTYAFYIMSDCALKNNNMGMLRAMQAISKSSGVSGMIVGQVADIIYENTDIDEQTLNFIHRNKTGELICASLTAGAYIANADNDTIKLIEKIGINIGLAFQIQDDILDETSNLDKLGKQTHSDEKNEKNTFVTLYGLEKSKEIILEIMNEIYYDINLLHIHESSLLEVVRLIANRDR